jgi:hypothetical protein
VRRFTSSTTSVSSSLRDDYRVDQYNRKETGRAELIRPVDIRDKRIISNNGVAVNRDCKGKYVET